MSGQVLVDRQALEEYLRLSQAGSSYAALKRAGEPLRAALAQPAQAAADAAEQEGIMAGLNGCVGTHNPYLFGDVTLREAWGRGNARVQAVRDDGYQQGKRAAALFAADAAGVQHFALEVGEGVALPGGRLRLTSVQDGVGAFEFTPGPPPAPVSGALGLLRAAQSALEPYMRVIPGTGEPGVLNEAAQVAQRISAYLAQEAQE